MEVALGGQLVIRFRTHDGKLKCRIASAHIAKYAEGDYIALTARTNLQKRFDDGSLIHALDGNFFLQRTDHLNTPKSYLARFKFSADDIRHYNYEEEEFDNEDINAHV